MGKIMNQTHARWKLLVRTAGGDEGVRFESEAGEFRFEVKKANQPGAGNSCSGPERWIGGGVDCEVGYIDSRS